MFPIEIDNHADTHCFGVNFIPFMWTGMECSVSPFLDEYDSQENVPICSGATAYTAENGETVILIFGQGLWFGERMNKSLINPNQCRAYGIPLCDDPTDPHRTLGFQLEDYDIPFRMEGSTATFSSRCPTPEEMDSCHKILLSDPESWDPANVVFNISTIVTKNNIRVMSEYDIAMQSISSGYQREDMYKSLINSVDVKFPTVVASVEKLNPAEKPMINEYGKSSFTTQRHNKISPEMISKKWGCGLDTARNTLTGTTQLGVRSAIGPLTRRYRTDILQLHYRRLNTSFYTDTMFMKCPSLKGKTCAQVYTDGKGFVWIDPMTSKKEVGDTLGRFLEDVGVPNRLIYDGAPENVGRKSKFQRIMQKHQIIGHQNEAFTQKYNRAEDGVRELKRRWKQRIIRRRAPKCVWDYGLVWESEILSRMCRNGTTCSGMERITGDTPDISEWLEFEFYDLCWYWDTPNDIDNPKIGRWLGVSHRVGSAMCYWILTNNGTTISRTTVQHITKEETMNNDIMDEIRIFHVELDNKIGHDQYVHNDADFENYINEDVPDPLCNNVYPPNFKEEPYLGYDLPELDEIGRVDDERIASDTLDRYLGAEILVPGPTDDQTVKVVKRIKYNDNNEPGTYNPMLDASEYLVEFPDGTTKEISANLIAESMFSNVDSEGYNFQLLREIVDHKSDDSAIKKEDGYYKSKNGNKSPKLTTRGWSLLVEWKDGSSSWVSLKDLKVSNAVELAEYAVANNIDDEPAFNWWVKRTLKKRDMIISKVKTKYWKTTHKFGIRVPKDVEEALKLDQDNSNTLWYDAIQKEMSNVRVAFSKRKV